MNEKLYKLDPREVRERRSPKIQFGSVVYIAQEATDDQLLRVVLDFDVGIDVFNSGITTAQITFDPPTRAMRLLSPGSNEFSSIDIVTGIILDKNQIRKGFKLSGLYDLSFEGDWDIAIAKGSVPRHFK